MLPISFIIAYCLTRMTFKIKKKVLRAVAVVLACACIIVTGERIFTTGTYSEKENEYELPQAAIEICDYVKENLLDWKETIVVPNELLCDIRQYSSAVSLFYGRNAGGFISNIEEDETAVYAEMCKEEPDLEVITEIGKRRNCRYLVFNTSFHQVPEDMTAYGYEKVYVVEDIYAIYRKTEKF